MATKPGYRQRDLAQQGCDTTLPDRSLVNDALTVSNVLNLPDWIILRLAAAVDGNPKTKVTPVASVLTFIRLVGHR
jgi:hypothetical protein